MVMNVFSGNHRNEQIGSELNCSIGESLDQICKLSKRPINDEILILFKRIYTHNEFFLFQGLQPTIFLYLLTKKEKVMHFISMLTTYRHFWMKRSLALMILPWVSRHVTCVVITGSACLIYTLLEGSTLEWHLNRPWNRLLK